MSCDGKRVLTSTRYSLACFRALCAGVGVGQGERFLRKSCLTISTRDAVVYVIVLGRIITCRREGYVLESN